MKRLLYKGEPVVTFRMIDELHKRKPDTARRTFNRHKDRFIEDIHYTKTSEECLFEEMDGNNNLLTINVDQSATGRPMSEEGTSVVIAADSLKPEKILLTEKGYLLLVKAFTDSLSWQVQDALIDDYFRIKQDNSGQLKLSYDKQIEVLQLKLDKAEEKFERRSCEHNRTIKKLSLMLSKYQPENGYYTPMINAYLEDGQGISFNIFKRYLKIIKWRTIERFASGELIIDVFIPGLKDEITRFIRRCIVVSVDDGIYCHSLISSGKPFCLFQTTGAQGRGPMA